jgi:hypothetical protein
VYIGSCVPAQSLQLGTTPQLILATPCAFLAQEYTLLPRLSLYLDADDCLLVRRTWIVKFFVTSDVLTFIAQLAGTALTVVGAFIDGYANIGRIVSVDCVYCEVRAIDQMETTF